MYHLSGDWRWVCGEGPRGSRIRNKMTLMCDDMESHLLILFLGFPGGSAGKESTCNMGDLGSIPGLGRPPGEWNSNPLQYSTLENFVDYTVHAVAKSRTHLSTFHFHFSSCFWSIYLAHCHHHVRPAAWPPHMAVQHISKGTVPSELCSAQPERPYTVSNACWRHSGN